MSDYVIVYYLMLRWSSTCAYYSLQYLIQTGGRSLSFSLIVVVACLVLFANLPEQGKGMQNPFCYSQTTGSPKDQILTDASIGRTFDHSKQSSVRSKGTLPLLYALILSKYNTAA